MNQELETIGWNEMYIKQMDRFSIKKLYKALMGEYQKLALQKRLLTRDRLAALGCVEEREARRWDEEVLWANTHYKGKQARAKVYRIAVAASVYVVWQERNQRIFKQIIKTPGMLVRKIVQEVHL
ncbi:hypothetical protein KY284_000633 [Solanum tuberosum]|nr:hypothetical protein KY284_000633 [Solanum tuberosum]